MKTQLPFSLAATLALSSLGAGCMHTEPEPQTNRTTANEDGTQDEAESSQDKADTASSDEPPEDAPAGSSSSGGSLETSGGSSGSASPVGVFCEVDVECLAPEICCAAMVGSACGETCAADQVEVLCDGPEDCDGGVCCWGLTGGSSCQPDISSCQDLTPDVACNVDDDCPGDRPSCAPHVWVAWINICG